MLRTRSGAPISQPSVNFGAVGKSLSSPFGAPASTQLTIVLISSCERLGLFANSPCLGSANQGGIERSTTRSFSDLAHGLTSLKFIRDIGATPPGRWHSAQLLKSMGATFFVKVTAALPSAWLVRWAKKSPPSVRPRARQKI